YGYGYGGFGLGWSNWGWGSGWSLGFGWGLRALDVRGIDLHVAVGHQRRRHHRCLGVGRDRVLAVVHHLDADAVALGHGRRHLADAHAHDAQVGAGIDADGTVEVRRDGAGSLTREDQEGKQQQSDGNRRQDQLSPSAPARHHPPPGLVGRNSPVNTLAMLG